MVMQRWDPYRDLRNMDDTINRLWRSFGVGNNFREGAEDWNVLLDVIQKKDEILVKASVPGIDPGSLDVSIEDSVLTIKAERKPETLTADESYLLQERPSGVFYRALHLPDSVDANRVHSNCENGVLTIVLPKAEERKRKQITVKVSGGKALEASGKKEK